VAILFDQYRNQPEKARPYYEQATAMQECKQESELPNRDDKFDLAKYYNNLAMLLEDEKEYQPSLQYNTKATHLFEELARPSLTFTTELAQAHTLRGLTLQQQSKAAEAKNEYEQAIDMFEKDELSNAAEASALFHNDTARRWFTWQCWTRKARTLAKRLGCSPARWSNMPRQGRRARAPSASITTRWQRRISF